MKCKNLNCRGYEFIFLRLIGFEEGYIIYYCPVCGVAFRQMVRVDTI
jgi:hypothetical protein